MLTITLVPAAKRWNNLWTKNIICHNKVTVRTLGNDRAGQQLLGPVYKQYSTNSVHLDCVGRTSTSSTPTFQVTLPHVALIAGDPPEALVTKSYIDELSFELALWKTDGANIFTKVFAKCRSRPKFSQSLESDSDPWAEGHFTDIYTGDMNLSKRIEKRGGNDVDGSWGSYTIQEGKDDLFLINRRTGKKYTFLLKEVN